MSTNDERAGFIDDTGKLTNPLPLPDSCREALHQSLASGKEFNYAVEAKPAVLGDTVITESTVVEIPANCNVSICSKKNACFVCGAAHTRSELIKQGWKSPEQVNAIRRDAFAEIENDLRLYLGNFHQALLRLDVQSLLALNRLMLRYEEKAALRGGRHD